MGFFETYGFSENPFSSTNADREPNLASYFVPPPYFPSVKGDPSDPKSNVILAPRGGGKTAQKVMLEEFAEQEVNNPVFCITYDTFRAVNKSRMSIIGVDWHLTQIIQRTLAGIVALIEVGHGTNLTPSEKRVLSYSFKRFLGDLTSADAEKAFSSVKSGVERFSTFLARNGKTLAAIVSAIAIQWGFGKLEIDQAEAELREEPLAYIFCRLVSIIKTFGFVSVYVLIDRVDEVPELGNDSDLSFRFIEPLITNLHIMETEGVAFKVFLWDQTEDSLGASSFRRDRVPVYSLNWSQSELEDMLARRLSAYSGARISSLNQLVADDVPFDLHTLVCLLSGGSPRDVIRLVGRIIDEHTRVADDGSLIGKRAIESGIRKFSRERSLELYGVKVEDLVKIAMVSFTIGDLANDVFRISHQAARNKIQNFLNVGAVLKSGEIENPGNRPLHQYSLADPKLAFIVLSSYTVEDVLSAVCVMCPRCSALLVREGSEVACDNCSLEFSPGEDDSVLSHCALRTDPAEPILL